MFDQEIIPASVLRTAAAAVTTVAVGAGGQAQATTLKDLEQDTQVSGTVRLEVQAADSVKKVLFELRGPERARFVDREGPFIFSPQDGLVGWDTSQFAEGRYVLKATPYYGGRSVGDPQYIGLLVSHDEVAVVTENPEPEAPAPNTPEPEPTPVVEPTPAAEPAAPEPSVPEPATVVDDSARITTWMGIRGGSNVTGELDIRVLTDGAGISRVDFRVDGPVSVKHSESVAPYYFKGDRSGVPIGWDTTKVPNGQYVLTADVLVGSKVVDTATVSFTVANSAASPAPTPVVEPPQPTSEPEPQVPATAPPAPTPDPVVNTPPAVDPTPVAVPPTPDIPTSGQPGNEPGTTVDPFVPTAGSSDAPDTGAIGNGFAADRLAIARWDVVPRQLVEGVFEVGVVAFHVRGIDHVDFRVNGGNWQTVSEMSFNPRTGAEEYFLPIDTTALNDGAFTVEAVAVPTAGKPRVLETLTLFANNSGGAEGSTLRVGPSRAHKNIPRLSDVPGVTTILLDPGTYSMMSGTGGPSDRWVTIKPAEGVSRDQVVFNNGGRPGVKYIKLENVTIRMSDTKENLVLARSGFGGQGNLWVHDSKVIGAASRQGASLANKYKLWITDTVMHSMTNGPQGSELVRNVHVSHILSDSFSTSKLVVNSSVDDVDAGTSGAHPDIYQPFSPDEPLENIIIYGLEATNAGTAFWAGGRIPSGTRLENMAVVDVEVYTRQPEGNAHINTQFGMSSNHVLFDNFNLIGQTFNWRSNSFDNFVVRDSTFTKMNVFGGVSASQVADAIDFKRNTIQAGHMTPYADELDALWD
ncbi:MAG: hypothetical protein AAF333_00635 [Planctomycetota bacterium]